MNPEQPRQQTEKRFKQEEHARVGRMALSEDEDQMRHSRKDRAADAAVPASYDRISAFEFAQTVVAGFAVVRLRAKHSTNSEHRGQIARDKLVRIEWPCLDLQRRFFL